MLVDKQSELMSDLLFTVHQHGGDDVTWKPPIQSIRGTILLLSFKIKKATVKSAAANQQFATIA